MTSVAYEQDVPQQALGTENEWQLLWRRLRQKKLAMFSLVVIIVIYFGGIFAPLVAPYSPRETNIERYREGPSRDHLLGTDTLGRDLFSRVLYASRTTVIVTTAVVLSGSLLIGNTLGLLAGYRGGWIDSVIMRVGEVFSALPGLIMLILINVTLGERVREWVRSFENWSGIDGLVASGFPSYLLVFSALSLFFWIGTARVIRAQVLSLRERDFVIAAESLGAPTAGIIVRHLLPNVSFLIILSISSTLGGIAGSEIFLSWFGVGVQPPAASFGAMLQEGAGARTFQAYPHLLLVPGSVVVLLLFSFALLGDALNDAVHGR